MKIDRLFQVLVVGGTLLTGLSFAEATSDETVPQDQDTLKPIFCTQPEACVQSCG